MLGSRAGKRLTYVTMAEIALRVRLIGGDHVDVTYSDGDAAADKLVQDIKPDIEKATTAVEAARAKIKK